MKKHFQNQVAIITGAASGIGRELAVQLLSHGATVMATDVNLAGWPKTMASWISCSTMQGSVFLVK